MKDYDPQKRPKDADEPYSSASDPKSPYDHPPKREPLSDRMKEMMRGPHPKDKELEKSFAIAWDDLIKFGDCPVCHGDPMACPEPDKPASLCSRRRNAIKHMRRGRGSIRIPE